VDIIAISSSITCSSHDIDEAFSFGVKRQTLTQSSKSYVFAEEIML
jgi:hypothetical protein